MEPLAVVLMLLCGGIVGTTVAVLRRRFMPSVPDRSVPGVDEIEAALALRVLSAGANPEAAAAEVSALKHVTPRRDVDAAAWAEGLVRVAGRAEAVRFLEEMVAAVGRRGRPVADAQYFALLDLCFSFGLYTDTMTRLLAQYGIRRESEMVGRGSGGGRVAALRILGLKGRPSRSEIASAYRRLAATVHPDRFHDAEPEQQRAAMERFLAVAAAAESLLKDRD